MNKLALLPIDNAFIISVYQFKLVGPNFVERSANLSLHKFPILSIESEAWKSSNSIMWNLQSMAN